MKNKKIVTLIILGVMALVSLIYGIVTPSQLRRQIGSKYVSVKRFERVSVKERIMPTKRHAKRTSFVDWGRNPFLPKEVLMEETPKLVLNGIYWDKEKPTAIINNQIVGVGDIVSENIIIDIRRNRVVLNDGISDFELTLEE